MVGLRFVMTGYPQSSISNDGIFHEIKPIAPWNAPYFHGNISFLQYVYPGINLAFWIFLGGL